MFSLQPQASYSRGFCDAIADVFSTIEHTRTAACYVYTVIVLGGRCRKREQQQRGRLTFVVVVRCDVRVHRHASSGRRTRVVSVEQRAPGNRGRAFPAVP